MKPRKMFALIHAVVITVAVTVTVAAEPRFIMKAPLAQKPTKISRCLPLGKPCLKSDIPCCTLVYQNTYMGFGSVPTTCFKFGKGVCQVNQSIKNFNEYNRLVYQLNSTNFYELKNKYWSSIPASYTCPEKVTIELKSV